MNNELTLNELIHYAQDYCMDKEDVRIFGFIAYIEDRLKSNNK